MGSNLRRVIGASSAPTALLAADVPSPNSGARSGFETAERSNDSLVKVGKRGGKGAKGFDGKLIVAVPAVRLNDHP